MLIILALCSLFANAFSQNQTVGVELAGAGGLGSVNYGKEIFKKRNFELWGRLGLSTFKVFDFKKNFNPDIFIPVGLNISFGKQNLVLAGLGQVFNSTVSACQLNGKARRENFWNTYFLLGYEWRPKEKKWSYYLAYSPIWNGVELRHWPALGIKRKIGK